MTSPIRGHLAFYTLALAIGFSALAAGAIHLPVLVTYAALVVTSGLLVRFSRVESAVQLNVRTFGVSAVALALALICLLQALPLPLDWLRSIAPENADIWARSLRPFEQPAPSAASLSLAPGRSLLEAVQFATYAVVFAVAVILSRVYGAQRLLWLAFGSALAVAVMTAAHQLLGAERLYGLYRPMGAYNVAPLLNPNNRAGYLNLGFFCGLGLIFRSGSRPYLGLLLVGLCFVAAEVILCRSLGGTTCLALGGAAALLLALPGSVRRAQRRTSLAPSVQAGILAAIGGGAVLLALVGQGNASLGLDPRAWEKVELWRRSAWLASEHFPWGVGRGAFGSVFPAYQGPAKNLVFEHAENLPLQWATEWGVPVTVVALLALAWSLRPLLSGQTLKSPTRRCALIGCAVLLLQNLADLGLEVPAVSALLCIVLGALRGTTKSSADGDSEHAEAATPQRHQLLLGSCAVVLVSLALAIGFGSESTPRLRRDLYEQLATKGPPTPGFWAALKAAVRAYPAEPYFALLGSSAALAAGSNPLPWIARTLERNPQHAPSHLQLARILRARGANAQAFGAVRRALELDPGALQAVLGLAREWQLSPAAFDAAAPLGRAGAPLLLLLAERTDDTSERHRLLKDALTRDPEAADVHYRLALDLVTELSLANGACVGRRDECLDELSRHIRRAAVAGDSRTVVLESQLHAARGETEQAEHLLKNGCRPFPGDVKCLRAWVARALVNKSDGLQEAVNAYVAAGCSDADACADTHMGLGTLFTNAGRWHLALTHYQHATREVPSPEAWQAVARTAERLGDETTARDARRRVALFAQSQPPAPKAEPSSATPSPPETAIPGRSP